MPSEPVDLTNCDREPIHIPGAIQPHGVLLACRGDAFTVVQVVHYPAADIPAQARRLYTLNSNARRSWPACG